jgi:hypothetical protein
MEIATSLALLAMTFSPRAGRLAAGVELAMTVGAMTVGAMTVGAMTGVAS